MLDGLAFSYERVLPRHPDDEVSDLRNQHNPLPTDDLRAAMAQYHAVFTELMDSSVAAAPPVLVR